MSVSLYSVLPDTLDTQHAKEQSNSHSQVRSFVTWEPVVSAPFKLTARVCFLQVKYQEASRKQAAAALYHQLPETLETQHAKEASQLQSQVAPLQQAVLHPHQQVKNTFHVCVVVIMQLLRFVKPLECLLEEKLGPYCLTDPLQRGGEGGVGPPGLPPAAGHPGDPVRPRAHRHAEQRKTSNLITNLSTNHVLGEAGLS